MIAIQRRRKANVIKLVIRLPRGGALKNECIPRGMHFFCLKGYSKHVIYATL